MTRTGSSILVFSCDDSDDRDLAGSIAARSGDSSATKSKVSYTSWAVFGSLRQRGRVDASDPLILEAACERPRTVFYSNLLAFFLPLVDPTGSQTGREPAQVAKLQGTPSTAISSRPLFDLTCVLRPRPRRLGRASTRRCALLRESNWWTPRRANRRARSSEPPFPSRTRRSDSKPARRSSRHTETRDFPSLHSLIWKKCRVWKRIITSSFRPLDQITRRRRQVTTKLTTTTTTSLARVPRESQTKESPSPSTIS